MFFRCRNRPEARKRLAPSEMNQILAAAAEQGLTKVDLTLATQDEGQQVSSLGYFQRTQSNANEIFFETVKDADTATNNRNLASIRSVLDAFLGKNNTYSGKLWFPMVECRGFAKLPIWLKPRAHIVLVEMQCESGKISAITKHDSSSPIVDSLYPNKLKDIASGTHAAKSGCKLENKCYNLQPDSDSCGRFVATWISRLIKTLHDYITQPIEAAELAKPIDQFVRDNFHVELQKAEATAWDGNDPVSP